LILLVSSASGQGAKVLIVDDDPVNLSILEDLLRSAGYDIISAVTGNEALEVFVMADPPVQLVLLDVTLPDMSGHEVQDLNT
jgi:CheY-like chemotaxis protein